ncbi:hypothetical protein B0T14DRAFT_426631 [Immersiella caudata]|uniref:protein-tyrosine-phosphatase n=1 Tax=Immersiella caudata TaxID=314043 RepID=A0AA40C3K0_9PEZI|nr:hypothetical protein B0T14DRAFT_426631 [Immersiella caudata]
MPSAAVRRMYEDQIPSFMSVFDLESDAMDQQGLVTFIDPKLVMEPHKLPGSSAPELRPPTLVPDSSHKHNDSTSTQTTESVESSPTTTLSCTDSSDLSDASPSSSPDSPIISLMPLSSFAPAPFGALSGGMANLNVSDATPPERPMTSPAPRRPKNMKGLSIQPPFNSLSSSLMSEPTSPASSFIKPTIPAMKRKPSQLSLKTSTSDLVIRATLDIPTSPSVPSLQIPPILQRRALKHSTSSPHMLSGLKSATFGPAGGMTIPTVLERNETGLSTFLRPPRPAMNAPGLDTSIAEEDSPIRSQIANRSTFDVEPFHEVENNEDQKTPGYPDGPICIYPDNVFLYLEPSAEEASRFDLVINVAREVRNPFEAYGKPQSEEKEKPKDDSPIPDTALTAASFSTAFEYPPDELADTPTTPKAQSFKEPEYIHMPWDHNTDIAPELMGLCETIDARVKEGKKVLIHCQQGASRSASLIIAYGMYRNPALSVNDAYYAAQARSRWISPNMRLMYCLQDFQKEVSKKKLPPSAPWSGRSPTGKHRATLSADNIERPPKEPLTAPLPEETSAKDMSPERSPTRARGNSTPNRGDPISPGPSSAPSSFSWTEKEDENDPGRLGRFDHATTLKLPPALKPPQLDSGFPSANSFSKPPPSPRFAPICFSRPLPSPARPSFKFSEEPPMSPGFAPPEPFRRPPPPSPGFAPPEFRPFRRPPPPPSPGFGAHRFGSSPHGFGFVPLSISTPSQPTQRPTTRAGPPERQITIMRAFSDDTALLSPRVETMTNNPLRGPLSGLGGLRLVEVPPTPTSEELFSPRESVCPRDPFFPFGRPQQVADPRSPPTLGETPIVRSIDEVL